MRLRLDSIDLYHVRVPLREPILVGSAEVDAKEAVIVRLQTSRGTGWGESSIAVDPDAGDPTLEDCWDDLCGRIGPAVLDREDIEVETFGDLLDRHAGSAIAAAGLEIAAWHATATARNAPLYSLLGGVGRPIASGLCMGVCRTTDELIDRARYHLKDGYRRIKIRITPGWDIEPVARVRGEWPDLPVVLDCAGAFSLDHIETFRNLDKYGPAALEQPLPVGVLADSAQLQAAISSPICLSAPAADVQAVRDVAKHRAGRIVSVDVQRAGGLTRAREIRDAATKVGLTCWLGTSPDLGIGAAAGLHLATLDGFAHPADVGSSVRWFTDDLLEPPIVVDAGGYLHLPDGPGFGYRPNREKVEKHTIRYETLTA